MHFYSMEKLTIRVTGEDQSVLEKRLKNIFQEVELSSIYG